MNGARSMLVYSLRVMAAAATMLAVTILAAPLTRVLPQSLAVPLSVAAHAQIKASLKKRILKRAARHLRDKAASLTAEEAKGSSYLKGKFRKHGTSAQKIRFKRFILDLFAVPEKRGPGRLRHGKPGPAQDLRHSKYLLAIRTLLDDNKGWNWPAPQTKPEQLFKELKCITGQLKPTYDKQIDKMKRAARKIVKSSFAQADQIIDQAINPGLPDRSVLRIINPPNARAPRQKNAQQTRAGEDARFSSSFDPGPCSYGARFVGKVTPVSVAWNAKCLQSRKISADGTSTPYRPTVASLLYNNSWGAKSFCSGTLIAPNLVLTAAHCICDTRARDPRGLFFNSARRCKLGSYWRGAARRSTLDLRNHTVFFQHAGSFEILRVLIHPNFNWTGALPRADLAILVLPRNVPAILPSPLNHFGPVPNSWRAVGVGYGQTNPLGPSGNTVDIFDASGPVGLKFEAPIRTGFCGIGASRRGIICWRFRDGDASSSNASSCFGDSGGPMFSRIRGQDYLIGVTSGGNSCLPGAVAFDFDVYRFRKWIKRQIRRYASASGGRAATLKAPRQLSCRTCQFCGDGNKDAKTVITIPAGARKLRVSVNCTPSKQGAQLRVKKIGQGNISQILDEKVSKSQYSTVSNSRIFFVRPKQQWEIEVGGDKIKDCQIVATVFD